MRRRVLFVAVGAVIVGSGVFAATGIGGSDDKVTVGPTVHKKIERVSAADARAAGANVPFARARGAKKPKLSYFQATVPTVVPANTATTTTILTCPSGQRVVTGFYETDRLIAVDFFSALPPNGWEFGFVDLSGIQGVAFEGIVCAKGVK
jgi:hypothetical protein